MHRHTHIEHSQSISTASGRQQCVIKVQDLYLSHNEQQWNSALFSLYHYTATVPDGIILILTVYMLISNRCMCNLVSSSVGLFFRSVFDSLFFFVPLCSMHIYMFVYYIFLCDQWTSSNSILDLTTYLNYITVYTVTLNCKMCFYASLL